MATSTVLLLARHPPRHDGLIPLLQADGLTVEVVAGVAEPKPGLRLALIDVGVGREEARHACTAMHEAGIPVIVFSGDGSENDLVDFLDYGADDYLPRPDRTRELVARVRALMRRTPVRGPAASADVLRVGDVVLDADRHEVTVRGVALELPLKQFRLLELFLSNAGQVLPRATILRRVWGSDSVADSNTLEVQIKRLRRQIEDDPASPQRIRTIRGLGYLYANDC